MRQVALIISIFVTLFVLSSIVQAKNTITFTDSNQSIVQAVDLAVKSNYWSYLYTQETSLNDTSFKMASELKPVKLKSPTTAFLIALVPGSVVHGAGHFYAGKPKTGVFLFSMELIGAGLFYLGALSSFGEQSENNSSKDGTVVKFFGFALFVGSWVADVIGAPKAVKKWNNELLKPKA